MPEEWIDDGYGHMIHMPTHRRSGLMFFAIGVVMGSSATAMLMRLWLYY